MIKTLKYYDTDTNLIMIGGSTIESVDESIRPLNI